MIWAVVVAAGRGTRFGGAKVYEDLDGQKSPVRGIYGLWYFLPIIGWIIWFVQVQGALNRYWESKGASPA